MREASSPLAAVRYDRGFDIDSFLSGIAMQLSGAGYRLGGVLQASSGPHDQCATTIEIADLGTGRRHSIWEDRGACAHGCRLDERGLAAAAPSILDAISSGVDLVIVNRFGRAESRGAGLLSSLIAAVEAQVPVLTAVRPPYDEAWLAFHGGLGIDLQPNQADVLGWCRNIAGVRTRPSALAAANQHDGGGLL